MAESERLYESTANETDSNISQLAIIFYNPFCLTAPTDGPEQ